MSYCPLESNKCNHFCGFLSITGLAGDCPLLQTYKNTKDLKKDIDNLTEQISRLTSKIASLESQITR